MINLGLGLGFALCAKDRIRVDGPFATPAFLLLLIYLGVVLLPATLYLYVVHPDWAWLYIVDPVDVPGLAVVPVLVAHGGVLVAGWYGGAWLLRSDRGRAALYTVLGAGALTGLMVLLLRRRIGTYGSYSDFHDGAAANLLDVKLGYVLIALALAMALATVFTALELLRDSRRVRAR